MSRFDRYFEKILNKDGFHSIEVTSGTRAGQTIKGLFSFNYKSHSLDRKPIDVVGPVFLSLFKNVDGLVRGDTCQFNNNKLVVVDIKVDADNNARVEFEKSLFKSKDGEIGEIFEKDEGVEIGEIFEEDN